ncbi:MAG: class I SAM-dependent methyltransferase [Stellaceae bacterium]
MIDQSARDLRGSPDRFGWEWDAYAEILPEYEEQFRRWTVHLAPQDWHGKIFLDVGCGTGRNSFWPMTYGACEGCAVDIDERSLATARHNLAHFPAVEVMRSSAYDLPFAERFDIAFAIGVIHHLEDPMRALQRMIRAVKPGGRVLIWVYGREGNSWLVFMFDPLRRALFSRMPIAFVHHLSLYPAVPLWLGLRLGLRPNVYLKLLARFKFAHLRSIVFDQMLPRIACYWPREKVVELLAEAGLEDIRIASVNEMSWSAIGTRPLGWRETQGVRSYWGR